MGIVDKFVFGITIAMLVGFGVWCLAAIFCFVPGPPNFFKAS